MARRTLAFIVVVLLVALLPTTGGAATSKKTRESGSCSLSGGSSPGTSTSSITADSVTATLESGQQLNGQSYSPAVSDDARYVAFVTAASNENPAYPNLDIGGIPDTNATSDIYVLDRENDSLLRATFNWNTGAQANGYTTVPIDISADGRYVVYSTGANNLGPSDTNGFFDIYRFDQLTGENRLVSVSTSGAQPNAGLTAFPTISADGNLVAFSSDATNLVPNDTNGQQDVFVRDIAAGTTTRVSVSSTGAQGDRGSDRPVISANGRFVVFDSSSRFVPEDQNLFADVYLRDIQLGQTSRVSVSVTGGDPADGFSTPTDISADGRYVVFTSEASNLVSGDVSDNSDVFIRDRTLGITQRASVGPNGEGNGYSDQGKISNDGHYVAFFTKATNLWPTSDANGLAGDIFEFDVWANSLVGHLSVGQDDVWANGMSESPVISGDGEYVAYSSRATNLAGTASDGTLLDTNGTDDVFTHLWVEGRTRCETKRRTLTRPVPLPFAPITPGGGTKPDYDRKCQDVDAAGVDPAPGLTEAQSYEPFDSFTATHSYQGTNPVYLRWGRTEHMVLNWWRGWGYRKIKAKHGWSPLIRANVQAALLTVPTEAFGTEWVYEAPYTYKRTNCRIRVVVEYGQRPLEKSKNYPPAHIITAYSWKV